MDIKVHILCTCRDEEMYPATSMVFKSLRVGFPNAKVEAYVNGGMPSARLQDHLSGLAKDAGVVMRVVARTIHHDWIGAVMEGEDEPFFLCDTDVVFFSNFEPLAQQFSAHPLAGRFTPRFFDKFSNCVTMPRLHTSLLYMNMPVLRQTLAEWRSTFHATPFTPPINLINPCVIPGDNGNRFYDTCSLLYHAVGGWGFSDQAKDAVGHLHFGTISDIVAPYYPNEHFRETHFAIFENTDLLRGAWRKQDEWYAKRAC